MIAGSWVNREEYTPYGETTFGTFAKKRYRFTGKERDEESGLYYHGARYYAPWLARWTSCDPVVARVTAYRPYSYADNRPLVAIDPTGGVAILVVVGVAFLISLTIPNIANAPGPEDPTYPSVKAPEFAAQFAISYGSGGLGAQFTKAAATKTGTTLLGRASAGALGYGSAGALAGPASVLTNDIANSQLSTLDRYLGAAAYSGAFPAGLGTFLGGASSPKSLRSPTPTETQAKQLAEGFRQSQLQLSKNQRSTTVGVESIDEQRASMKAKAPKIESCLIQTSPCSHPKSRADMGKSRSISARSTLLRIGRGGQASR